MESGGLIAISTALPCVFLGHHNQPLGAAGERRYRSGTGISLNQRILLFLPSCAYGSLSSLINLVACSFHHLLYKYVRVPWRDILLGLGDSWMDIDGF